LKPSSSIARPSVAFTTVALPIALLALAACDGTYVSNPEARQAIGRLNTEVGNATYYVSGWVPPQKAQSLSLSRHAELRFAFQQCPQGLDVSECDQRHAWKHIEQRLLLTQIKPTSVKVVEVSGAPSSEQADTGHALIYRCVENMPCTEGDLGTLGTVPIPCPNLPGCERAAADLEKLIALAPKPANR
jgi:hypothetical protein